MLLFSHTLSNLRSSHKRKSLSSCLFSNVPSIGLIQLSEADTVVLTPGQSTLFPASPTNWRLTWTWVESLRCCSPKTVPLARLSSDYISGMAATIIMCRVCGDEADAFLPIICRMLHALYSTAAWDHHISVHFLFLTADLNSLVCFWQVLQKCQPL